METIDLNLALKELVKKVGGALSPGARTLNYRPPPDLLTERCRGADGRHHAARRLRPQTGTDVGPAADRSNRILPEDRGSRECLQDAPTQPFITLQVTHGGLQDSQFVLNHDQFVIPRNRWENKRTKLMK